MQAAQELRKSQPHSNGNFRARGRASPSPPSPVAGRRPASRPKSAAISSTSADFPPCLALPCLAEIEPERLRRESTAAAKSSTAGPPSATCGLVGDFCDLRQLPPKPCALLVAGIELTPHRTTAGAKLDSAPSGALPLVRPRAEHGQR
jgi:hypothetical protein